MRGLHGPGLQLRRNWATLAGKGHQIVGAEGGDFGFEGVIGGGLLLDGVCQAFALGVAQGVGHETAARPFGIAAAGEKAQCFQLVEFRTNHIAREGLAVRGQGALPGLEECLAMEAAGAGLDALPAEEGEAIGIDLGAEDGGEDAEFAPSEQLERSGQRLLPGGLPGGVEATPHPVCAEAEEHRAGLMMGLVEGGMLGAVAATYF